MYTYTDADNSVMIVGGGSGEAYGAWGGRLRSRVGVKQRQEETFT